MRSISQSSEMKNISLSALLQLLLKVVENRIQLFSVRNSMASNQTTNIQSIDHQKDPPTSKEIINANKDHPGRLPHPMHCHAMQPMQSATNSTTEENGHGQEKTPKP